MTALFVSCAAPAEGSTCEWPMALPAPDVLYSGDMASFILELPDSRLDSFTAWPTGPGLDAYRTRALQFLDPTPAAHERLIRETGSLDRGLNRRMLTGEAGRIRESSCLERLLMALHNEHFPLMRFQSEFRAWFLERDGALRIYFATPPLVAWGPNLPTATRLQYEASLAQGWRLAVDIHSHPFRFSERPGVAGGFPAPSQGDLNDFPRRPGDSRT